MTQSNQAIAKKTNDFFPSVFSDFFDTDRFFSNRWFRDFEDTMPAVNIRENGKSFSVEFAAPGFSKEDFKINVENNVINVSAEKEKSTEKEDSRYTRKEFFYSSFSRSFTLPQIVNADDIVAAYRDGILALDIPKKEEAKTSAKKEIKIA